MLLPFRAMSLCFGGFKRIDYELSPNFKLGFCLLCFFSFEPSRAAAQECFPFWTLYGDRTRIVPLTYPFIHARIPFVLFHLSSIDKLNDWRGRRRRGLRASLARFIHLKLVEFIDHLRCDFILIVALTFKPRDELLYLQTMGKTFLKRLIIGRVVFGTKVRVIALDESIVVAVALLVFDEIF